MSEIKTEQASSPLPDLTRTRWLRELVANQSPTHYFEIDGTEPLPDFLTHRINKEDGQAFRAFLEEQFTPEQLTQLEGTTIALPYVKWGDGHKFQAFDLGIHLADFLKAKVIYFDPMDHLPPREHAIAQAKKDFHHAMQKHDLDDRKRIGQELKSAHHPSPFMKLFDQITNHGGTFIADLVAKVLPAPEATGGASAPADNEKLVTNLLEIISKNPTNIKKGVQLVSLIEASLTERSISAATLALAAETGAEGIYTTHPYTLRTFTPASFLWLPKRLWSQARKALNNLGTFVPDNGYCLRSVNPEEEAHPTLEQTQNDMILTAPFAFLNFPWRKRIMPWFNKAFTAVADAKMARSMQDTWDIPTKQLPEIGTIADTLTPQQAQDKWAGRQRNLLFACNGNGSNWEEFVQAAEEISIMSDPRSYYLEEKNLHLVAYLGKHGEKEADVLKRLHAAGYTDDEIEIIDYNREFFDQQQVLTLNSQPARAKARIHIIKAKGDAAESEAKGMVQRLAHAEFRPPGENILCGAKVATLEFGTPTGGPNEPFNMIWAAQQEIGIPSNWPPTEKHGSKFWQQFGLTHDHHTTPEDSISITDLIRHYFGEDDLAQQLALNAYNKVGKQSTWIAIGLIARDLLSSRGHNTPNQVEWNQALKKYQLDRDHTLSQLQRATIDS